MYDSRQLLPFLSELDFYLSFIIEVGQVMGFIWIYPLDSLAFYHIQP
jgi:hypothetical protein